MALLRLPLELVEKIATCLSSEMSLSALARANRDLYAILNQRLYGNNIGRNASSGALWAAENSRVEALQAFLNMGMEADVKNQEGQTLLSIAADYGREPWRPSSFAAI